jgi:hypothetical protein
MACTEEDDLYIVDRMKKTTLLLHVEPHGKAVKLNHHQPLDAAHRYTFALSVDR